MAIFPFKMISIAVLLRIPSEEVQINDTDTELTGPENTQEQVGSSNPILIGQLRMIQVVR